MGDEKKDGGQQGGIHINIHGPDAKVGDVTGRDKIVRSESTAIHAGDGAMVMIGNGEQMSGGEPFDLAAALEEWKAQMEAKIDAHPELSTDDKSDLKDQVKKIEAEAAKKPGADTSRLERLINVLGVMAPDIFEVAITTLANPLAGIGLVLKKIGDRAKLTRQDGASAPAPETSAAS